MSEKSFGLPIGLFLVLLQLNGLVCSPTARAQGAEDFNSFTKGANLQYQRFTERERTRFDRFEARIRSLWGSAILSTRYSWVRYSENLTQRSSVDFRTGVVNVSVLLPQPLDSTSTRAYTDSLASAVKELLQDPGTSASGPPLLQDQVIDSHLRPLIPATLDSFAAEVARPPHVTVETARTPAGQQRTVFTTSFHLSPEHIQVRAKRVLPYVERYAHQYNIDPSLVLAIIHTESCFNPMATSSVPAYGLMQLVPATGGFDAYQHVHHRRHVPTPLELYDPESNIQLGCGYLNLIMFQYLGGITKVTNLLPCAILAYTGGVGNLTECAGAGDCHEAGRILNAWGVERVHGELPICMGRHCRRYLDDVLGRMAQYAKWHR